MVFKKTVLDVGCGFNPRGDVNVDVEIHSKPPNFIKASGLHLPFSDNSFDVVECHHLIEHMKNIGEITTLFNELLRVTRHIIHLTMPHRLSRTSKLSYHYFYFDENWWHKSLKNRNLTYYLLIHYNFRSTDKFSPLMGFGKWFRKKIPIPFTLPNIDLELIIFKHK